MPTDDLAFATIEALAPRIESGEISALDLTRAQLDRIDRLDGGLKSYATVMGESALAEAERASSEIAEGQYRGPLHGIPLAVKDLCYTNGVRTMGATAALTDFVPNFDSTVVARLRAAGAILLGKLNLTEGAMAGYNRAFAVPVNPWDAECWTGVSSSGSGVATSAGLCYASLGSDTGGSIRSPSASCGIVGIKPTWGRVSRYGVLALAESLDHVGPMTRSVWDAAAVFEAIAGDDPNDATTVPEPAPSLLTGIDAGASGLRIGWDEEYATADVIPSVAEAVAKSVELLAELGAEIVPVEMPDMRPYMTAWPTLCGPEAVAAHAATYPSRRDEYGNWFKAWLDRGSSVTGAQYAEASNQRAELTGLLARAFEGIDMLACPAMATLPPRITEEGLYDDEPQDFDPERMRFTAPYNMNRAPSITLPNGMSEIGLPTALQLIGKPLGEAVLCRAGYALERALGFSEHPPV